MGSTTLVLALGALVASDAEARITRIEIKRTEQASEGKTFGTAGAYLKIVGRAYGEVDPRDPSLLLDVPGLRAARRSLAMELKKGPYQAAFPPRRAGAALIRIVPGTNVLSARLPPQGVL